MSKLEELVKAGTAQKYMLAIEVECSFGGGDIGLRYNFIPITEGVDTTFRSSYVETYTMLNAEAFSCIIARMRIEVDAKDEAIVGGFVERLKIKIMSEIRSRNKELKALYYDVEAL